MQADDRREAYEAALDVARLVSAAWPSLTPPQRRKVCDLLVAVVDTMFPKPAPVIPIRGRR